ncbi:MAG: hypothetical protein GWP04_08935 [Gammaproteobacteria bacterium]|nr:hypothetical protein [Gammaproteobacteria bacterium]
MRWRVDRLVGATEASEWMDGFSDPVFHDDLGTRYCVSWDQHWVSCLEPDGSIRWSCGPEPVPGSPVHIFGDLENPAFVSRLSDGGVLVSCFGNHRFVRVDPEGQEAQVLIDGDTHGLRDTGYGVVDHRGHIWVNEITGCRIWEFSADGQPIRALGDGQPGFTTEAVPCGEVRFNWVYDIRCGPDGNIYVLDSRNYALRMIDVERDVVVRVAGTGRPGYTGDGGDPLQATFGSSPDLKYDGPWTLSFDEDGNIFIGDTQNHVVRMVERSSNTITTIAGRFDYQPGDRNDPLVTDPMRLNFSRIAGMHYFDRLLYITQEKGELVILAKT